MTSVEKQTTSSLGFIVDTTPSTTFIPSMPNPKVRNSSPTPSSSSDEVLFQGRKPTKVVQDPVAPRVAVQYEAVNRPTVAVEATVAAASSSTANRKQSSTSVTLKQAMVVEPATSTDEQPWEDQFSKDWEHRSKPGIGWLRPKKKATGAKGKKRMKEEDMWLQQKMAEEDRLEEERQALADYAENLKEHADSASDENPQAPTFKLRHLALSDGLDTSTPVVESSDTRDSDQDYRLFSDGMEVSPARKNPAKSQEFDDDSDDSSSSTNEEDEEPEDDDTFIAKRLLRQTDEEMAFLLWEQEERGIIADEQWLFYASSEADQADFDANDTGHPFQRRIVTRDELLRERNANNKKGKGIMSRALDGQFDDESSDGDDDDDDFYDEDEAESDEIAIRNIAREQLINSSRGRKSKRGKHEFPSATLLADVLEADPYGGFDIMDFDRPSLRPKKKGRKFEDAMPFELSDQELRTTMQTTWEADREKKRLKQAERAELRSQGLLGRSKKGKAQMKEKYLEGMDIRQIKDEFQQFFASTHDTLLLPPMGKNDRKLIHELGIAFELKTKSSGKGDMRAPMLIRTKRMGQFDDEIFKDVCRGYQQGFFKRLDMNGQRGKKGKAKSKKATGGGGNNPGVTYRNGEVVGGSAPEIGVENRGRAMLEKLGWSKGMALGAIGNEGILQPVTHVVKTGKAGLG